MRKYWIETCVAGCWHLFAECRTLAEVASYLPQVLTDTNAVRISVAPPERTIDLTICC